MRTHPGEAMTSHQPSRTHRSSERRGPARLPILALVASTWLASTPAAAQLTPGDIVVADF
jgi:hypothetical protein